MRRAGWDGADGRGGADSGRRLGAVDLLRDSGGDDVTEMALQVHGSDEVISERYQVVA